MKISAALASIRLFTLGLFVPMLCTAWSPAHAAVTAGGLVVVGYTDNNVETSNGDDVIALLATETINAGETIYLTNNGWSNDSSMLAFSGADPMNTSAKGFEGLTKLTINSTIYAGTVIKTNATSSAFTWTTSGVIPTGGSSTDQFGALDLTYNKDFPGFYYGDQIYIFQADGLPNPAPGAGINPLLHPTSFIHALSMGRQDDPNSIGFIDATPYQDGAVPDGKVSRFADGSNYDQRNVLQLYDDTVNDDGDPANDNSAILLDPFSSFFGGTFHLNMSDTDVANLQSLGGTKAQWLTVLADSSKWTQDTSLTPVTTSFNVSSVPEPSRALLLLLGFVPLSFRRRR